MWTQHVLDFVCCVLCDAVYRLLEEKGGLKLLEDPNIHTATQEILPDANKTRAQVREGAGGDRASELTE